MIKQIILTNEDFFANTYTRCWISKSFSFWLYSSWTLSLPLWTKFCFSKLKSWSVYNDHADRNIHKNQRNLYSSSLYWFINIFTLILISFTFSCASCMMKFTICLICLFESDIISGWFFNELIGFQRITYTTLPMQTIKYLRS